MIKPKIFSNFNLLRSGQSTRLGGVSKPPYDSMNLGSNTEDHLSNIEENKKIFSQSLGFDPSQVVRSKQVHGNEILVAEEAGFYEGYDAIITNKKNLLLAVSTADCSPILIYDAVTTSIAAIHAGWKGTKNKLVALTTQKMQNLFGSKTENLFVFIGPCISECSFEVDNDVAQYFHEPFCKYDANTKKYFVDLKGHNKGQLLELGVPEQNIEVSEYDTFERTDLFFSHRKEKGVTGRMWSAIGIKND
jgi:polyphenol oxidase